MGKGIVGSWRRQPASRIATEAIARAAASSARVQEAWRDFSAQLAMALGALGYAEYLVVDIRGRNRYVQFAAQGPFGMRAEATSDFYLVDGDALDAVQHQALLGLGWSAPTRLPDEIGRQELGGSPNYFVDLHPPLDHRRLAELAVATLTEVFGARSPRQLEYRAFQSGGVQIRFPSLGIAVAED